MPHPMLGRAPRSRQGPRAPLVDDLRAFASEREDFGQEGFDALVHQALRAVPPVGPPVQFLTNSHFPGFDHIGERSPRLQLCGSSAWGEARQAGTAGPRAKAPSRGTVGSLGVFEAPQAPRAASARPRRQQRSVFSQ
jgi:hypothetical protein